MADPAVGAAPRGRPLVPPWGRPHGGAPADDCEIERWTPCPAEEGFTTEFPPTASTRGGMKRAPAAASTPVSPRRKPGPIDTGLWNMGPGFRRGDSRDCNF